MSPETGYGFDLQDNDWVRVRQLFQLIGSSLRLGPTSKPTLTDLSLLGDLAVAGDVVTTGSGRFDGGIAIGTDPVSRLIRIYGTTATLGVGLEIDNLGAADAIVRFALNGVAKFVLGVDNSVAGDPFKISVGSALGTNDALTLDSSGNFVIPGTIAGGAYNGVTFSTNDLVIDDVGNNNSLLVAGDNQIWDNTDGFGITGGTTPRDLVVTGGDWTIDQSVASGAAPTFNNLKIEGGIPILIFKDNTDTGDSARGFQEWRDSNNVRLGFFGNSSYTHDDLVWKNESSGGHLLLETTGAGIVSSNTGFAATGSGRFDGGLKTGATYILAVDETKSLSDYLLTDGSRALAGAWDMGSQALTNVNIDTGDIATAVTNSEWDAAYTHVSNDGTDHSLLGATPGTVSASLAVIVDANKDIDFVDGDIKSTGIFEGTTFQGYGDADTKIEFVAFDGFYFQAGGFEFARFTKGARASDLELNSAGLDINTTIKSDDNALLFFVDAGLNVIRIGDGGTTNYAEFSTTGDIALYGSAIFSTPKIKLTLIGGYAIKLTNTTGATSVIGQTVKADPDTDDAVILTAADDPECIGVFLDAVADDAEAWVVVAGIADIAMEDNTATTRGNWVQTSETEAGYADATDTSPQAAPQHFNEIGHCIESVAAGGGGTHILARCVLHFN